MQATSLSPDDSDTPSLFPATVVWSEDWEGNWFLDWTVEAGTWEVGEPTSGPNEAYAGMNVAATVLDGGYDARVDSRLVSAPLIVPPAQENPRLRFWHWFNFGGGDNGEVQVSTDGGTTWETISPSYLNTSSAVWTRPSLDLSAYAGQTIQLAFDFHSDGSGLPPGWYIDEVTLFCGDERCPAVYDLTFFEEGESPCTVLNEEFQASAFIRTDPNTVTDDLGTTTLVFSYNDAALDYPDTPTDGIDYTFHNFDENVDPNYGNATVTKTGPGELTLNIMLQNTDQGTVVAKEFMDVATLTFTVSDRSAMSELAWTPSSIVARGGNNSTEWVQGTFVGCDIQLPVELAGPVEATVDEGDIILRWTTASETNNTGFDVEHRVEDADWRQVAFIEGAGTTTEPQRYTHRVRDLVPGTHRFRLKQIDVDGAFEYSPEVEVIMGIAEAYQLSAVYPNPSTSLARFTITVRDPQNVRLEVYNAIGQRVATLHDGPLEAATVHRFALDGRTLTSGTYLVRATGETFTATRRATLVR